MADSLTFIDAKTAFTILIVLGTFAYGGFQLILRSRRRRSLLKLPGFVPHPIYGDKAVSLSNKDKDSSVKFFQVLLGYTKLFQKEGLFLTWIGFRPFVFLFSPETVQSLLSSRTELAKGENYRLVQPWFKTGLLTSTGEKWKERRKFLTPAFHYEILGNFIPIFDEQSKVLVEILEESTAKEWITINLPVSLCTLDIICETSMGVHLGAQKNSYIEYVKAVFDFIYIYAQRRNKPWLWNERVFSMTQMGKKHNKVLTTLTEFTKKAVKERKSQIFEEISNNSTESVVDGIKGSKKRRMALMDLLLTHHFNNQLTESDICEEIDTFMFAGHDTTAVSVSWTLYNLGLHLNVQQKVYEEIYDIFGEDTQRPITMDDIRKMRYLECVIKESLRIYPAAPFVVRHLEEDLKINGFTIPRGTNTSIFIYGVHHNPEVYPNPEVFDPDRFAPENCVGRNPYAFIPFSAGARNCIGQKFALLEEKVVIANLVRNYTIKSLDPPDKVTLRTLILLKPNGNLRLKIRKRPNRN